jgi:hypothetical protein
MHAAKAIELMMCYFLDASGNQISGEAGSQPWKTGLAGTSCEIAMTPVIPSGTRAARKGSKVDDLS